MLQVAADAGITERVARTCVERGYFDPSDLYQRDIVTLRVAAALLGAPVPFDGRPRGRARADADGRDAHALALTRNLLRDPGDQRGARLLIMPEQALLVSNPLLAAGFLLEADTVPVLVLPVGDWAAALPPSAWAPPATPAPAPATSSAPLPRAATEAASTVAADRGDERTEHTEHTGHPEQADLRPARAGRSVRQHPSRAGRPDRRRERLERAQPAAAPVSRGLYPQGGFDVEELAWSIPTGSGSYLSDPGASDGPNGQSEATSTTPLVTSERDEPVGQGSLYPG